MKKSLFKQVVKIALSKMDNHPEYDCYMHYSFVIQDNKIVDYGTNSNKTPPVHHGYNKRCLIDDTFKPKTHSEYAAYMRAKGLLKPKSFEIINLRFNKVGELRLSKPCDCCYLLLKELGCKRFYYSSTIGFLECV